MVPDGSGPIALDRARVGNPDPGRTFRRGSANDRPLVVAVRVRQSRVLGVRDQPLVDQLFDGA
jgi:hypothetical protein